MAVALVALERDGEPIAGDRYVDVAEVMLSRPANDERFFWHSILSSLVA